LQSIWRWLAVPSTVATHMDRSGRLGVRILAFVLSVVLFRPYEIVTGQEVDIDTQKFLEDGIQRGAFLNGKWISYPRNVPIEWDCAINPTEKNALWDFFVGTGGLTTTGWRHVAADKWDNQTCPCIHRWRGVTCDQVGHVVGLNLAGFGLQGPIPEALGSLVWVKSVQLQVNELTGPIPGVLGTLVNLEKLFLQNNQLTGAVPYRLATLPRLSQLFVDKPE
jgi:hypothetical protein